MRKHLQYEVVEVMLMVQAQQTVTNVFVVAFVVFVVVEIDITVDIVVVRKGEQTEEQQTV